ncbi:MAG: VOC family protein [Cohaesibacter sp.]|nr:VOC family protein [Cohaesibacter sp.]
MTNKTELKLDHITVVARSLEEGASHIKALLDIDMPMGGSHPLMGTHNRLLSLGPDCFLELIAVDPFAKAPDRPRWFNLDHFNADPVLATWVVGSKDINASLTQAHCDSGSATHITRGNLSWLISIADDGTMPLNGAFPTLIEWPEGPHPASHMVDLGCRLHSLTIQHPKALEIEAAIMPKLNHKTILFKTGPKSIRAEITTPSGMRALW